MEENESNTQASEDRPRSRQAKAQPPEQETLGPNQLALEPALAFSSEGTGQRIYAIWNNSLQWEYVIPPKPVNAQQLAAAAMDKGYRRPRYGAPMPFRAMLHEPINEAGVLVLFGMLAEDLGFAVDYVHPGYADCEAKRFVGRDRWERVRIEFEFRSRNFSRHQHDPRHCDLIVCWEHDWPECPIEVLELRSVIRAMAPRSLRPTPARNLKVTSGK